MLTTNDLNSGYHLQQIVITVFECNGLTPASPVTVKFAGSNAHFFI